MGENRLHRRSARRILRPGQVETGKQPDDDITQPEVKDIDSASRCVGDGCDSGGEIVGRQGGGDSYQVDLTCTKLYWEFAPNDAGMAIGLTGGDRPVDGHWDIGELGVVCAPWSSWS